MAPRDYSRAAAALLDQSLQRLTVRVVLQYPNEDSIRDMKARFFSLGPWNEPQLT